MDEIGYRYVLEQRGGYVDRRYEFPAQQAIAWELRNQLHRIGLPETRRPGQQQGVDGWGRRWTTDELGYPYFQLTIGPQTRRVYYQPHRREVAARTRRAMQQVDVESAASTGVRNAALRAFNAVGDAKRNALQQNAVADLLAQEGQHRPRPFFESVVAGINQIGLPGSRHTDALQFQKLLEKGIEDAVVLALNSAARSGAKEQPAVSPPATGQGVPQPVIEERIIEDSITEEHTQQRTRPGVAPPRQIPPPPVAPPVRTSPAVAPPVKTNAPQKRRVLEELPPGPVRTDQSAVPAPAKRQSASNGILQPVAYREVSHQATSHPQPQVKQTTYHRRETVDAGWVFHQNTLTPLPAGRYELHMWAKDASRVDVYQHGALLMRGARYARYYEDAREFLR